METSVNNPLVVRCEYCGGDVSYDIAKQKYCCAHCGAEMDTAEHKAQYSRWKRLRHDIVMQDLSTVKSFSCPACGAHTIVAGDNVTAQCPFCQNTMIDAQFAGNDLPEVIIPFRLGKEEAEAKLREWLQKNSGNPAAKVIEQNMKNFTGCYLPYHIVRGASNSNLQIRGVDASYYPFRAYLKHTAVNASKDLSNMFLDGIEPFEFDEALEFNLGYLNHQEAKVQNVDGEALVQRIGEETQEELYKTFVKKMKTKELSVILGDDLPESIPALMPVYLVKCEGGVAAAVNGQTGKVSVDTGKTINLTRTWWMVPALATLVVVAAALYFSHELALAIAGGAVFGIVFFAVAHSRHEKKLVPEILTYPKTRASHNDTEAEFVADFGKGLVPARLRFFTPWRILKVVVAVLAVIFLPLLIAIPIQLLRGLPLSTIQVGYGAAWYVIPGFIAILAAGGIAKYRMYNSPIYYEILPNGKTKRRRTSSQKKITLKEMLSQTKLTFTVKSGCLIIGFILFLLIGSVSAMIF